MIINSVDCNQDEKGAFLTGRECKKEKVCRKKLLIIQTVIQSVNLTVFACQNEVSRFHSHSDDKVYNF